MTSYDTNQSMRCPLCANRFENVCWERPTYRDSVGFECEACGRFEISRTCWVTDFAEGARELPPAEGVLIAHKLRQAGDDKVPMVSTSMMERIKSEQLPSAATQATNLIRMVGERGISGQPFQADESTAVKIGTATARTLYLLIQQLEAKGWLVRTGTGSRTRITGGNVSGYIYDLTLDGWQQFEDERRGRFAGNYGFIAMKFGDAKLDALVRDVLKPSVQAALGFEVIDMRDVARAGVIDNIMRAQIRDAAFVVVDLTHDNAGAYWEAGYAEGLGKPVIYMCERKKFSDAQTHFDTNHCTTVMWEDGAEEHFAEELLATLRRSLNLF